MFVVETEQRDFSSTIPFVLTLRAGRRAGIDREVGLRKDEDDSWLETAGRSERRATGNRGRRFSLDPAKQRR